MGGSFIFEIVIFRAKEIGGSIYRGVIFWGIYIRCQGGEIVGLGWLLWVGGLVKIRARGKDQTKGTKETYIRV